MAANPTARSADSRRCGLGPRLAESLETALELADGLVFAEDADSGERTTFSAKFACPVSGFTIDEIEPRLFSFNNPFGACPACDGLGTQMYVDPELVVPDDRLSLAAGAVAPWANSTSQYYRQTLDALARHFHFDLATPFGALPEAVRTMLLYGSGDEAVTFRYDDGSRDYQVKKPFEGVIPNMERRWKETESSWIRDELARFQTVTRCETCAGKRLKPAALAVKVAGVDISETTEMSIEAAEGWFGAVAVENGFDEQPVICGGHSHRTGTARQQLLDPLPLVVAHRISAHQSALQKLTVYESKIAARGNRQPDG